MFFVKHTKISSEISSGIYVSACNKPWDRLEPFLQSFNPQTKPNRFVIRIESFTWLQAATIPSEISKL